MSLGIALSGGGTRGAAHIGVLKALEENNIKISYISGCSSGSIVAMLYASGYKASELEKIFTKYANQIVDYSANGFADLFGGVFKPRGFDFDGIISGDKIETIVNYFCSLKGIRTISDIRVPIGIPAVDINTCKTYMFVSRRGKLVPNDDIEYAIDVPVGKVCRASSAYPVIFKPCFVNGRRLVDGGVKDNVPVDILKNMGARRVIAVNLGYAGQTNSDVDNIIEIAQQSIDIMGYLITKPKLKLADVVIKPKIYDVKLLETSKIPECIKKGYDATMASMDQIKRITYV